MGEGQFSNELQDSIDKVPASDVLGDFNARVGVLKAGNDEWHGVLGKHGLDECNEEDDDFLQFCALNQLTVMNTWFQKKRHHYGTWMHPANKPSLMIDLVVMRSSQRLYCMDVQVMRGATYWIDHKLVRAKLRIDLPKIQCHQKRPLPFSIHLLSSTAVRDEYRVQLEKELQGKPHDRMMTPEENWAAVKSCIMSAAEKVVGRGKRKQPEWFEDFAADEL